MERLTHDTVNTMASLYDASQEAMRLFMAATGLNAAGPGGQPLTDFVGATTKLAEAQQEVVKQMTSLWSSLSGAPLAPTAPDTDKRFASEAWRNDPRFAAIRRAYQAYADYWRDAVETAAVDDKIKEQLRFSVRQFIDAMSPSNFLATNPEALALAIETQGQSVAQGMALFLEDMAKGRVTNHDEAAFEIGTTLATTPGAVIYENELMQLIQYTPTTPEVHARPLVMIPPCINKFYIMDLQPDNSLVRYALEQGQQAFMVSWRNVPPDLGHLGWDDYLEQGVMKAIEVAKAVSKADQVNTLGFCVGGTLLASALAVLRARDQNDVASMTLLTTMLDFSDTGELGALVSEESVAARERMIGDGGLMHGKELNFAFTSLRANDLMWQYVVNGYLKGKAPPAFDMLYWNADGTNLPGPMFCFYVRNMYLENNLREPGGTIQCGVPVDLTLIDLPAFIYASREDHIVPWKTAYQSTELLAGDTTFLLGASGHIAGVINHPAKKKRNYWAGGEASPDPEQWLATAREEPGSWWPAWTAWLAEHAGPMKRAPAKLGSARYKPIEPAPGRYVMAKAE